MYISIQYLRALSAIAVVFTHTIGYTGGEAVAIFFTISAFLMMDIMAKKNRSAKEFFLARFFRVAPLYYLLSIVTLLLGIAYDPTILRIIQSFSFTGLGTVLPVGFTLTYEFVFYTLCAVSIFLWGGVKKEYLKIAFIIIFLIIGDFILNYILGMYGYMYGNYFWIFVFGIISFYIYMNNNLLPSFVLSKIFLYFIFLISIVYIFFPQSLALEFFKHDVDYYAIYYSIPAFLIVLSLLLIEQKYGLFKNDFLLLLGNASYSIYLSHYIFIQVIRRYYDADFSVYLLFIGSIIIGVATYKFIEMPLTTFTKRIVKHG